MPVETEYEPKTFNCDGSTTEFSVSFRINETSDAKVYLLDTEVADPNDGQMLLTETSHYSISAPNNEYGDGFKVTTVATYAAKYKLIVARDLAETQTANYIENDSFPSKSHENVVDKLTMLVQELKAVDPRLLKLAITSAYSDLTLPDPVAEYLLAWKADKTGLKNVTGANIGDLTVSDFIKNNLLDDANAAEARATLVALHDVFTTQGDTLYEGAAGPARLAAVAAGSYLRSTGVGANPEWSKTKLSDLGFYIGSDTNNAADDQVITGVGFQPSLVIFMAADDTATNLNWSIGFDNGTSKMCGYLRLNGTEWLVATDRSIEIRRGASDVLFGSISALGADGFTINWTLVGTCVLDFAYLCIQ